VHDLHVWAVGSDQLALACHVTLAPEAPRADEVLCHLHDRLAIYGIHHSTIQIDPEIERHPEPVW
jgi:Co/Zn/Cd efflux system component